MKRSILFAVCCFVSLLHSYSFTDNLYFDAGVGANLVEYWIDGNNLVDDLALVERPFDTTILDVKSKIGYKLSSKPLYATLGIRYFGQNIKTDEYLRNSDLYWIQNYRFHQFDIGAGLIFYFLERYQIAPSIGTSFGTLKSFEYINLYPPTNEKAIKYDIQNGFFGDLSVASDIGFKDNKNGVLVGFHLYLSNNTLSLDHDMDNINPKKKLVTGTFGVFVKYRFMTR